METYTSPKQALFAHGKVKSAGKGRISRLNHDWLDAEIAAGRIAITDNAPKRIAPVNTDKAAPKSDKPTPPTGKYIADFTILYHKDDYHAVGPDGKHYGMAEVCNNCRVSLVQNVCPNPVILGDIPVRIVPNVSAS